MNFLIITMWALLAPLVLMTFLEVRKSMLKDSNRKPSGKRNQSQPIDPVDWVTTHS